MRDAEKTALPPSTGSVSRTPVHKPGLRLAAVAVAALATMAAAWRTLDALHRAEPG